MASTSRRLRSWATTDGTQEGRVFFCPGCKEPHSVCVKNTKGGATWKFNGDEEKPTFNPSILVTNYLGNTNEIHFRCHSYVRDGKIEFLGDCMHELKGQTVEIPDWPSNWAGPGEEQGGAEG